MLHREDAPENLDLRCYFYAIVDVIEGHAIALEGVEVANPFPDSNSNSAAYLLRWANGC